jgi:aldehyde dehydrogenase (NAD+)
MGDLYQVFDTSDLPGGVINMVSGRSTELLRVLAEHADLDGLWSFGDDAQSVMAKSLSVGNLKQVFTNEGRSIDWFDKTQSEGKWWLRHAVQVKNVWVPYGE